MDSAYTRQRLLELGKLALKRGYAIGIGHPHKTTVESLEKTLPELKKMGIEFVMVSELVIQ
jgi:hypothetical protein